MRKADRHDILFLQFFAIMTLALWSSGPYQSEIMPSWLEFYRNKIFVGRPLYFFIAGLLWILGEKYHSEDSTTSTLTRKAKRLLVPYFFVGSMIYLSKVLLTSYVYNPLHAPAEGFLTSLFYPTAEGIGYLWFLPSLFILFMIAAFFMKEKTATSRLVTIYVLAVFLFFIIENLPINLSTDTLGIVTALNNLHFFTLGILAYRFSHYLAVRRIYLSFLGAFHVVLFSRLFIPAQGLLLDILNWAFYTLLVIVIHGLSTRAGKKLMRHSFPHDIGLHSYPIFIFSWFVLVCLRIIIYDSHEQSPIMINAGIVICFAAGILLPLLLTKYLDKKLPKPLRPLIGL